MKFTALIVCAFFFKDVFSDKTFAVDVGHGIQILSPTNNHSFVLEINELGKILEVEDIKDRHVVVVSIAGAFRQGKSFLLNFFLKYLEAQYKKHDITDWLGENEANSTLTGFEWASGRKRKTVGIWMWSEIFTHDFVNGEKVAIILLDTQGIFDDQTSTKECTTIFALSTMISSIQCYNIMQNIQEDHLQHLQLFTEYGRFALQQTNKKPFQKLLFIVRDWPFADEFDYGWQGEALINEILDGNDGQTPEMRQLRSEIRSSFAEIVGFLMPHPGMIVARKKDFSGSLKQIDPDFVKYAKVLAQDLFKPENLIVKKINGQKVRARELIQYLQEYIGVFNSDALPEPQSMYEATAKVHNLILSDGCVNDYNDFMEKQLSEIDPYFKENNLTAVHQKAKIDALMKYDKTLKLGSEALMNAYRNQTEDNIEQKFSIFQLKNAEKRNMFIEKANLHNEKVCYELEEAFKKNISGGINKPNSNLSEDYLSGLYSIKETLQQFDSRKMGDDEISSSMHEKLESDLNNFISVVNTTLDVYNACVNQYNVSMSRSFDEIETYLKENELINLHQDRKKLIKAQFVEKSIAVDERLVLAFQQRMIKEIENQFSYCQFKNREKHEQFIKKANDHNEKLSLEVKDSIRKRVIEEINKLRTKFDEKQFSSMLSSSITAAIKEFDIKKIDDGEVAVNARRKLITELDSMSFKRLNTVNSYNFYLEKYSDWMRDSIEKEPNYFTLNKLQELHNKTKSEAIAQFQQITLGDSNDVKLQLKHKLIKAMDVTLPLFVTKNDQKHQEFIKTTESYNRVLIFRLVSNARIYGLAGIREKISGLSDSNMDQLCNTISMNALTNFDELKRGDYESWSLSRESLQYELKEVKVNLKKWNKERRDEYLSNEGKKAGWWSLAGSVFGGVLGFVAGGPVGAVAGAAAGAATGGATSGAITVANIS